MKKLIFKVNVFELKLSVLVEIVINGWKFDVVEIELGIDDMNGTIRFLLVFFLIGVLDE